MKQFIFDNWLLLSPILYEIIARVWPTKGNISLLDNVWKLIDFFIPNKRIPDGKEKMVHLDERENIIIVPTRKHILKIILILCLFSFGAQAQIWQNFKGVRLVNNSDTTKQFPVQGSIFFDDVNNTFWGHNGVGWKAFGLGVIGGDFWKTTGTTTLGSGDVIINHVTGLGSDLFFQRLGVSLFGINSNPSSAFFGDKSVSYLRSLSGGILEFILGTKPIEFQTTIGQPSININPTTVTIENNISGPFAVNNSVGDLNLSGTNNLTLNTAASTRLRIDNVGTTRFSVDNGVTGIDIIPASPRRIVIPSNDGIKTTNLRGNDIFSSGTGPFVIQNTGGLMEISSTAVQGVELDAGVNTLRFIGNQILQPANSNSHVFADIYTPVITNQSNVSSSNVVALTTSFIRIQNVIKVETSVNITATAASTLTQVGISLPVPSNLGSASMSGMGVSFTSGENQGRVIVDSINDVARFEFTSVSTAARFWNISFQYTVNP